MARIELLDIECFGEEMNRYRRMKALSIDGESEALKSILKWEKSSPKDFRSIAGGAKLICTNREIPRSPKLVNCKGYPGLMEIKAVSCNARLFCFIHKGRSGDEELVICTGSFWKTSGKVQEIKKQDFAMKEAYRLKTLFLESQKEDNHGRKAALQAGS